MRISVHDRRFHHLSKLGPLLAALALAAALFLPLGRGNVYSMNGPFDVHRLPVGRVRGRRRASTR